MNLQDYPHLKPLSGNVKYCVVLLHGYGSSGHDLISLGNEWQKQFPDTLFVAPHALTKMTEYYGERYQGEGYQWFALPEISLDILEEGIAEAVPALDKMIDHLLAEYGLKDSQLALVGFSQGAMMALSTALSRSEACAAVIAFSGAFVMPSTLSVKSKPPVLLIHGDQDEVVPISYALLAQEDLSKRGVSVTSLVCQNTGHTINQEGFLAAGNFLYHKLILKD